MSRAHLEHRALMLHQARQFFAERGILEVDCNALMPCAPIDAHIDPMYVPGEGYLHTSPEYAMKQLLAEGSGDIYYLGHVFRKEEPSPIHTPEFAMAEWYRLNFFLSDMIQETCAFLFLFGAPLPIEILSYQEAFLRYAAVDPFRTSLDELARACKPYTSAQWDRTTYLHLLLSHAIEPNLGHNALTVLTDYPAHEAALARTTEKDGAMVAERFEVYMRGIELANGYCELSNGAELRQRFQEHNQMRRHAGKEAYALDETFLQAIDSLPPCCGVSVGFDRAIALSPPGAHIQRAHTSGTRRL